MNERTLVPAAPVPAKAQTPTRVPGALLQRKCACAGSTGAAGECEECKKKKLQRKAVGNGPATAPPIVHDVLRSPGQPLDTATRAFFEPRFGHDFSKVRVHADSNAAASARDVDALAYTVGNRIVFNHSQYAPASASGRKLLAHELTHVVQQSHSSASAIGNSIAVDTSSGPLEAEAERASMAILENNTAYDRQAGNASATPGLLQRQKADAPAAPAPTAEFDGCDEAMQKDLREKQGPALEHVSRAVNVLAKGWDKMDPVDKAAFSQSFDPSGSGDIDDSFVKDVRGNYQTIHSYMGSLSFDCNPSDWTLCGTSKKLCRADGNLMWTCFGALHVCPGPYSTADEQFKIETMIHESTHNALHTTDREYSNSPNFKRLKPRGGLFERVLRNIPVFGQLFKLMQSNSDTLYNPDSYSGFAMRAGGAP